MTINHPNVTRLPSGETTVYLVGTAHVSRESETLVRQVIETVKPDAVCVELCASRLQSIRQKERWRNTDIVKVIREKKAFLLLSNLILASFQRRIADRMDIAPGQEMLTAVECAEAAGAELVLADRDIRVTLGRTWRRLGLWSKVKLMLQLLLSVGQTDKVSKEDIERMKQEDILESLLAELGNSMPMLREVLIDERDRFLTRKIRSAPGATVVAVVGAGHVPGIRRYWDREIDLEALSVMPPKRRTTTFLQWFVPLSVLLLIFYGFLRGGAQAGADMILWWVAANGILAGVGALAALGHPLTIASSILAAPITSLNPMIAAGWVSGMVEALSRRPKVMDFEALQDDIRSVRGFWKNKVTRILLVVVFTNLGSSVGTMVAFPLLVKALHGAM
jgi:pheromone shutdown-related protein TraB